MNKHTEKTSDKQSLMERIAAFIVDKRKAFYLICIGVTILCIFSSSWVAVNDDLTSYLPDTTETRRGLTVMDAEFITFGTRRIMVDNVSFGQAQALAEQVEMPPGVKSVEFDNTQDRYTGGTALLSVIYDGALDDPTALEGLDGIKALLDGYNVYITSDTGGLDSASLAAEMQVVMLVAVVIILLVLPFTSHTYMEIPVLVMTFGMAALMNKGTNFLFGEISFISNSVAVVLQLALAIDYAIILCHRYTDERKRLEPRRPSSCP